MTDVSIVIAGRNSAEWIRETIASAVNQSHRCEVIYSDDCSTDDTVSIARGFEASGVTIVTAGVHRGVCAARNRGAAIARGQYLCFLDSDDVMPPTYIADHRKAIQPGQPFVYGHAHAFGAFDRLWKASPWEQWDRWSYNTVNTSSLYARWAFDAAGGWLDAPTMWDHDLALRAMRFGSVAPAVSPAVLGYRQHASSWSAQLGEKSDQMEPEREIVRRRNARLSVASLFSGRLPDLFPEWLQRLAYAVRYAGLHHQPDLVIAFDQRARPHVDAAQRQAEMYAESFASIRWLPLEGTAALGTSDEIARRNAVATWMAKSCDQIRGHVAGDLLWLVEDDILIPMTGCRDLWNAATAGVRPPEMVSGVYRSRHLPELLIAGRIVRGGNAMQYPEATELPAGKDPVPMDFVGTGCVMIWNDRPAVPKVWPSHVRGTVPAHDWAISIAIKEAGGTVLWHPLVRCGHATTSTKVIWP